MVKGLESKFLEKPTQNRVPRSMSMSRKEIQKLLRKEARFITRTVSAGEKFLQNANKTNQRVSERFDMMDKNLELNKDMSISIGTPDLIIQLDAAKVRGSGACFQ